MPQGHTDRTIGAGIFLQSVGIDFLKIEVGLGPSNEGKGNPPIQPHNELRRTIDQSLMGLVSGIGAIFRFKRNGSYKGCPGQWLRGHRITYIGVLRMNQSKVVWTTFSCRFQNSLPACSVAAIKIIDHGFAGITPTCQFQGQRRASFPIPKIDPHNSIIIQGRAVEGKGCKPVALTERLVQRVHQILVRGTARASNDGPFGSGLPRHEFKVHCYFPLPKRSTGVGPHERTRLSGGNRIVTFLGLIKGQGFGIPVRGHIHQGHV